MVLKDEYKYIDHEVCNGKQNPDKNLKMEVLYVNILREYLEMEYKEYLGDKFDLERVIDDFVFLTFFVGNDFMHQIFCMNIRDGDFDLFLKVLA